MRGGSPVMQIRLRTPTVCAPSSSRLDAQDIAVAAAEMQHRFDSGLLLDQLAGHLRAHAGAGARAVGHVDAVDPGRGAQARAFDFLRGIHAARRQDLDERDELAGRQLRAQLALLRDRNFRQRLALRRLALPP